MEWQIITDAKKVDELWHTLDNISCDDGCEIEAYTDSQIISEAKYVLSTYTEDGHINQIMLEGDEGPAERKVALKECRQLRWFLKKNQG